MPQVALSSWENKPLTRTRKKKPIQQRPEALQLAETDKAEGTALPMSQPQANPPIRKERSCTNTRKWSKSKVTWENLMNMRTKACKERHSYMKIHITRTRKEQQKREPRRNLEAKPATCLLTRVILKLMGNWPDTHIGGNLMSWLNPMRSNLLEHPITEIKLNFTRSIINEPVLRPIKNRQELGITKRLLNTRVLTRKKRSKRSI